GKGRVFQSDGKEVKLTLTGYFWRYGIRKAIQVSIFRMNRKKFTFYICGKSSLIIKLKVRAIYAFDSFILHRSLDIE
ncbi:hypothetical protein, partial [Vibrio metschnikovii]|uniref:hypothetical protein n=1 Tax=Vibrio metschnikovii TaxID=28172 RepID=UPI001C3015BC